MTTTTQGKVQDYVDADGVKTYYEAIGDGEPLVLLHGGLSTIETFAPMIPGLAAGYRVYSPERRGHGRTPDVEGPITAEIQATDTITFIETLGIGPVHLVGWSDGALIGLLVALRRPDLVRKLVMIDHPADHTGDSPAAQGMVEALKAGQMRPEMMPPMLRELYGKVSPDGPEHFDVVFHKIMSLDNVLNWPGLASLKDVAAPTLVLLADDGMVTAAHGDAMRRALPNSQLAVVPGTTHLLVLEKPSLVDRLVLDFLASAQVAETTRGRE